VAKRPIAPAIGRRLDMAQWSHSKLADGAEDFGATLAAEKLGHAQRISSDYVGSAQAGIAVEKRVQRSIDQVGQRRHLVAQAAWRRILSRAGLALG
jgi:hypothetical protein